MEKLRRFCKTYKMALCAVPVILAVLMGVWWIEGQGGQSDSPDPALSENGTSPEESRIFSENSIFSENRDSSENQSASSGDPDLLEKDSGESAGDSPAVSPSPEKGETAESPAGSTPAEPNKTPAPSAAPSQTPAEKKETCTLSISCQTALAHLDELDPGMREILPADGWILPAASVTVQPGDTVFDVLQRACRENGIPLEFSVTPGTGGAYIEGIDNLYEFDCGSLSGWKYKVNGVYPNVGCSSVTVQPGDTIVWQYTCRDGDVS